MKRRIKEFRKESSVGLALHNLIQDMKNYLIIGGGHGIGFALVKELHSQPGEKTVFATFRNAEKAQPLIDLAASCEEDVIPIQCDPLQENQMAELTRELKSRGKQIDCVINCIGVLHDLQCRPEKSLKQVDLNQLLHVFKVNAFITPLLAKHMLPLLSREKASVFCALSAKVGSIADNRLGGWYAYRASKSALNMFLKTISLEFKSHGRKTIVLAVHPGTTKTGLSDPFLKNTHLVVHTPAETAKNILSVIDDRSIDDSGKFYSWNGQELPW